LSGLLFGRSGVFRLSYLKCYVVNNDAPALGLE